MRLGTAVAASVIAYSLSVMPAVSQSGPCTNPNALGVSRTVEIDTTGGPGFGFEHYKEYDFLVLKEVVLTFDDGPQVGHTHAILKALADHCTKATFFSVGKMAAGLPEILRDVARGGHTVGTHTWAHIEITKLKDEAAWKAEIEKGISAARRAVGGPIAPFFRYPSLKDTKDSIAYLQSRNIAVFSTDIDSFDFKFKADALVKNVMAKLEKKGKGILLMHDIQPGTAKGVPALLDALKAGGYKIVHMKPKGELKSLAEYDAMIDKDMRGMSASTDRPMSSVIKTVDEPAPQAAAAPGPAKK
jgi:peptidoglycan/xylan/chitin deacetylase (PgdA/CDA1 family)